MWLFQCEGCGLECAVGDTPPGGQCPTPTVPFIPLHVYRSVKIEVPDTPAEVWS